MEKMLAYVIALAPKPDIMDKSIETRARPVGKDNVGAFFSLTATTLFPFAYSFFIHSLLALKKIMLMSRHGGANRILRYELLEFNNLLSPANLL